MALSLLGPGFNPWSGNSPTSHMVQPKRRKRKSMAVPHNTGQLRQAAKKGQVSPVTQVAGFKLGAPKPHSPAARVWGESVGKELGATSLLSPPPKPGAGCWAGKCPRGVCPRAGTAVTAPGRERRRGCRSVSAGQDQALIAGRLAGSVLSTVHAFPHFAAHQLPSWLSG